MKARRRLDTVKLTKDGLFGEYYDKKLDDMVLEGIRVGGYRKGEFLWHAISKTIVVDGKVTLLDLIRWMATLNADEMHALSLIANANLARYLIEFAKNPDPIPDTDSYGKLIAIEVYRVMELSNYDLCNDVYDLNDYTCAHGIGEVHKDVEDMIKAGTMTKEQAKDCNTYAIEFTPWQKMLDLPIRIREHVYHSRTEWKKTKPRPWMINVMGSKKKHKMGTLTRDVVKRDKEPEIRVRAPMQLGEFFTGLFNELCFFASPKDRNVESDTLKDRVKDVEKQLEKEKKKKKK